MASVYKKDNRWYLRFKDATGRWKGQATTAKTKIEARRLAFDLERKAERQRLGLEPRPTDATETVSEICKWWVKERCPEKSRSRETSRLETHLYATPLGRLSLLQASTGRINDHLHRMEKDGMAPASVNRLRAILHCVFNAAIKAEKWTGMNPVTAAERRQIPKGAYSTLRAEEVPLVLSYTPPKWVNLVATAIWTGMRKGELIGLRKSDVDLEHGVILVARSYDHETTKGGHTDAIPVADPLFPFLVDAIEKSTSELVFPRADGTMLPEWTPLEGILRATLSRAGLVLGYEHVCRRCKAGGSEHSEKHPDAEVRVCPTCGMRLWPKATPRSMRFHDLRHTTATLLMRAGVDVHRVQKILRHKDVRTTTAIYGHLDVEDLRSAVNQVTPGLRRPAIEVEMPAARATVPGAPNEFATPLLRDARTVKEDAGTPGKNSLEIPASKLARPRGFEPLAFGFVEDIHVSLNACKDVQACANTGSVSDEKSQNVQAHASSSKDFAGSLLDGIQPTEPATPEGSLLDSPATDDEALRSVGKLLTVRQVAKLLGMCPATVYRLCERGELRHYRIRNAIRVDLAEVKALLQRSRETHHR